MNFNTIHKLWYHLLPVLQVLPTAHVLLAGLLTSVDTEVPKVEGHLQGPCLALWWTAALVCEEVAKSAQDPPVFLYIQVASRHHLEMSSDTPCL